MKNAVAALVLCACLFPTAALAEDRFERGTFRISLNLNSADGDISPDVAYFVANNLELAVHYDSQAIKFETTASTPDDHLNATAYGAAVLYDFPTGSRFVPFLGAGLVAYNSDVEVNGVTQSDTRQHQLTLVIGVRFLIGNRGSIDLGISRGAGNRHNKLPGGVGADITANQFGIAYSVFI
jgi:opacity protein-like surface antigen